MALRAREDGAGGEDGAVEVAGVATVGGSGVEEREDDAAARGVDDA